jgi:hypothetical protein
MHIQALALANERTTIGGHLENLLLRDLPDGFVDRLDIVGDTREVLDRTLVGDDHVLHAIVPETELDELLEEPGTDDLEFASEDTSGVDVAISWNEK